MTTPASLTSFRTTLPDFAPSNEANLGVKAALSIAITQELQPPHYGCIDTLQQDMNVKILYQINNITGLPHCFAYFATSSFAKASAIASIWKLTN